MSNLGEDMIRIAGYEQVPIQAIADWHQYVRNNMPLIEEDNVQNVVDRILGGYGLGDSDDEYENAEDYNDGLREEGEVAVAVGGSAEDGSANDITYECENGCGFEHDDFGEVEAHEAACGNRPLVPDDDNIRNGNQDSEEGLGALDDEDPEVCAPDTITLVVEGHSVRYVREDIVLNRIQDSDYQRG